MATQAHFRTPRRPGGWLFWWKTVFIFAWTCVEFARGAVIWTTNSDETITLASYAEPDSEYEIPDTIEGRPVTVIGFGAFRSCSNLASVTIGANVTNVEAYAFDACSSLSELVLPAAVRTVGNYAFNDCRNMKRVELGAGVADIERLAFAGCESLTNVAVDVANTAYASADGVLCDRFQTKLILCPQGKAGTCTVPDSVTEIADSAFSACSHLTQIAIGGGVERLGLFAFFCCSGLSEVRIPAGVEEIGTHAFDGCRDLQTVRLGSGATNLGEQVFSRCSSLETIEVDSGNPAYADADGVLFDAALTKLIRFPGGREGSCRVPDGVVEVAAWAFEGCTGLTSVAFPSSLRAIGSYAFYDCPALLGLYFTGEAIPLNATAFVGTDDFTVYYRPDANGWGDDLGGRPAVAFHLEVENISMADGETGSCGFAVQWPSGNMAVVEACLDLNHPVWQGIATSSIVNGSCEFRDWGTTNHAVRFYRVRPR